MFSPIQCPCCKSLEYVAKARVAHGRIACCAGCGTYRVLPPRSQVELQAVHEQDDYFTHPYFEARRSTTDLKRINRFDRILRTSFANSIPNGASLLDVGCDTGAFLIYARERYGMKVAGIDVSPAAVKQAAIHGLDVWVENIALMRTTQQYDLVVLNDVLEHVSDPQAVLINVASMLRVGGRVFIATPNGDAFIYMLGGLLDAIPGTRFLLEKLFVPYHEFHFSRSGLSKMTQVAGLTPSYHETYEFPLDEFGHGYLLKAAMYVVTLVQRLIQRPSLQILVAIKNKKD